MDFFLCYILQCFPSLFDNEYVLVTVRMKNCQVIYQKIEENPEMLVLKQRPIMEEMRAAFKSLEERLLWGENIDSVPPQTAELGWVQVTERLVWLHLKKNPYNRMDWP